MTVERRAGDIFAEAALKAGSPPAVTFQVTDRCNYDCVHCFQEHTTRPELSLSEITRILEEVAAAGTLFLTLMGGEFFMRRDADDILACAHELGFAIKLLTTGHHVHDRRADFIATLRPIQVDMSMYSAHPGVHEAITLQPGSWQRTFEAARRLLARKVPVKLKAPAMSTNAADLAALARLAQEIGAFYSFDPKITGLENGDQAPVTLRMDAATLAAFYRDPATGVADALASSFAGYDPARPKRPDGNTPCGAGLRGVSINPQGQVWPCNALPLVVGDLTRQSFAQVWSGSTALEDVRQLRWASLAECNACGVRDYCQRCHGMALLEQGELRGPSLEACRHAVAVRDVLRERGLIPATETALPPTWDRVDSDGQHHRHDRDPASPARRPPGLRVLA
jgi:radical SAM protein with 4Fe4S-binding SPASM domain